MIISHKYKYIFIKTQKTAGTSIEDALGTVAGKDDIVTPIGRNILGNNARNYEQGDFFFHEHIAAMDIIPKVPKEVWNSYYKFTFERNPWDKVVSFYCFDRQNVENFMPFDRYIIEDESKIVLRCFAHCLNSKVRTNYDLYTINDEVVVDFIGRYETLEEDFQKVCALLDIPFRDKLPKAKGWFRREKEKDYRKFYNERTKNLIAQTYHREITLLGYRYETH